MNPSARDHCDDLAIRTVVVGVDGSPESRSALEWAGRVVEPGGVIHAVAAISPASELVIAAVQVDSTEMVRKLTDELQNDWTGKLRDDGHSIACNVIEDDPADALMHVARTVDADLVVVGVHAKPRHAPRTIGHVTARLIHQTTRPLAIVDNGDTTASVGGTTVVAHAGGGAATRDAVQWAAHFADIHGTDLSLVRSTPNRPSLGPDGLLDVLAFYLDPSMLRQWAAEDLAQLADELQRSTERDLRITWSSRSGASGPRLIEASIDASLIVVGRSTLPALDHLIPKDLRHVIIHAPCPVVVIPPTHPQPSD